MMQETKTVYVARKNHKVKCYHEDEDCPNMPDEYRTVERNLVRPQYELCATCDDEQLVRQTSPDEPKECPYCGESFGRLPVHLPKCEET